MKHTMLRFIFSTIGVALFSFVVLATPQPVHAAACNFYASMTDTTKNISSWTTACAVAGVDGVDGATLESATTNVAALTLGNGGAITINNTGILIIGALNMGTGTISILTGGVIKPGSPLYVTDTDADGWPDDFTLYDATTSGRRRLAFMRSYGTIDCGPSSYSIANSCCAIATRYQDADGDGYGNPNASISACTTAGYVDDNTDCNDTGTNAANVHVTASCYVDSDNDNYGDYNSTPKTCTNNATCASATWASDADGTAASSGNFAANNTDCGNSNANAHPSSTYCGSTGFTNQANAANNFDYNCNGAESVCAPDLTQSATATFVSGSEGIGSCNNNNADCRSSSKNTWNNAAIACGANGKTCTQTGLVGGTCGSCGTTNGGTVKCIAVSATSAQTCK